MTLITGDELARGAVLTVFGGLAGLATVAWPGSPLWLVPAGLAVAGSALTIPEVRQEVTRALPALTSARAALGRFEAPALPRLLRRAAPSAHVPRSAAANGKPIAPADDPLLHTLEGRPHRLIIGYTGGGKTTLLHAQATRWAAQGSPVLVLDPDAAPGQWPGCRAVGGGDNYAAMGEAIRVAHQEVARRRGKRAAGQRSFRPMHIVIDEAQDVVAECPAALDFIEDVARRGRKIGVHLTLGVQDNQVATLGLEGKSHLLRNFITAEAMQQDGRRVAVIKERGTKTPYPIPRLPDPEDFITAPIPAPAPTDAPAPARVAAPEPDPAPTDDLLESLLSGSPVRAACTGSSALGSPRTGSVRDAESANYTSSDGRTTVNIVAQAAVIRPARETQRRRGPAVNVHRLKERAAKYAQVRALVAAGKGANEVAKLVSGERKATLALVRRAREELGK